MSDSFDPRTHNPVPGTCRAGDCDHWRQQRNRARAVALACARFGATVISSGRNARKLEAVHTEIETAGWPGAEIALLDLERQ